MDFSIPEPMRAVLDRVRELVEREVIPLEPALLSGSFRDLLPRLQEVRRKAQDRGLWAPQIPASYGGMGLSLADYALVAEELGRSPLGHFAVNAQAPDAGNMEILIEYGTDAQKERWLAPLVRGEVRSCFAMT